MKRMTTVLGAGVAMMMFAGSAFATMDAQKIAEIRSNGSESLWAFLSRLPASFEAQIFYGLYLSGMIGALMSWGWKYSQGQASTEHFTLRYIIGQIMWNAGVAVSLITSLGFQESNGTFLGWMYVIVTGGFAGYAGDIKVEQKRDVWTDDQRAAAAKAPLGGNG